MVVSIEDRVTFEHIAFWKTVLSDGVALGVLRISMAISLLRLNKDLKWYRWSLYAVMGMAILLSLLVPLFSELRFPSVISPVMS